jgi:hypothetical protein
LIGARPLLAAGPAAGGLAGVGVHAMIGEHPPRDRSLCVVEHRERAPDRSRSLCASQRCNAL